MRALCDDDPGLALPATVAFVDLCLGRGAADPGDRDLAIACAARCAPETRRALLGRRLDVAPRLAAARRPLRFLHGAEDAVIPAASSRWASDAAGGAPCVTLDGVGHAPFLEAPDPVAQTIAAVAREAPP
jgi:pimeloyl-ACP methyl ester carboxylesterase